MALVMLKLRLSQQECLYSAITRHWQMMGAPNVYRYKELLGLSRRHRMHPFLTSHLTIIGQSFGMNPDGLLQNHTLYPVFRAVTPDAERLKQAMLGDGQPSPVILSRLPHVGRGTPYSIKYCPLCAKDEREQTGFAVWHLSHQIPGVTVCDKHHVILNEMPMGDFGADRHFMALPPVKDMQVKAAPKCDVVLAESATYLMTQCCNQFRSCDELNKCVHQNLASLGFITTGGYVRQDGLKLAISKVFSIQDKTEFSHKQSAFCKACIIARKEHECCTHPLAYAVLLYTTAVLADSNVSQSTEVLAPKTSVFPIKSLLSDARNGLSINRLCKKYSRSKCFVTRQLELHGIPHGTNSMATDKKLREKILSLARQGVSRQKIAEETGAGIGVIDKLICNTPGLAASRKEQRYQSKLESCIEKIKQACRENPTLTRTQLRKLVETEYAILYKADRELLFSLLPAGRPPSPKGRKLNSRNHSK
jgi:transposase